MASHGRAAAKPKGGASAARASSSSRTFRLVSREEGTALEALKRLATRSAGRPLDDATRAEMEASFAHDFSRVRIHTDEAAGELAEALGADAVTIGADIFFAEGEYRPGDGAGEELLAHELAHVAERAGALEGAEVSEISSEQDAIEHQAGAVARDVVAGLPLEEGRLVFAEQAARTIALRATRPAKRRARPKAPDPPLGEMRIVDRIAGVILGAFWNDPDDKAGRVRNHLEHLGEKVHQEVLDVIDGRLGDADKVRFAALLHSEVPAGTEVNTPQAKSSDDTHREQRQERSDDENAALRSSDPKTPEGSDAAADEVQGKSEPEETEGHDPDAEEATTEDTGEDKSEGDAEEKDQASAKRKRRARKKGGRAKGEQEEKKEKKGDGNEPKKPRLGDGKGEGDDEDKEAGGEGAPREGAEIEAKGGAGGPERPGGGSAGEADSVDTSAVDQWIAKKSHPAKKPAPGGMWARFAGRSKLAGVLSLLFGGGRAGRAESGNREGAGVAEETPAGLAAGVGMGGAASGTSAPAEREGAAAPGPARAEAPGGAAASPAAARANESASPGANEGASEPASPSASEEANESANPGTKESENESANDATGAAAAPEGAQDAGETAAPSRGQDEARGAAEDEVRDKTSESEAAEPAEPQPGAPTEAAAEEKAGAVEDGRSADAAAATRDAPREATRTDAQGGAPEAKAGRPAQVGTPKDVAPTAPAAQEETVRAGVAEAPALDVPGQTSEANPLGVAPGEAEVSAGREGEAAGPAREPASEGASDGEAGSAEPVGDETAAPAEAEKGEATPEEGKGAEAGAAEPEEAPAGDAGGRAEGADVGAGGANGGAEAEGGGDAGGNGGDLEGGGSGGGGSAIPDKPAPALPDVSNASPPEAMAAMTGAPPAAVLASLGQVSAASDRTVGAQRNDLAQNPPQIERPSGAPAEHPPTANPAELAAKVSTDAAGKVDPLPAGAPAPPATAAPEPQLGTPPSLRSPAIPGDAKVDAQNLAAVQSATDNLPTADPALDVTAGEAPKLDLSGDANPTRTTEQRAKLDESTQQAHAQGTRDAAQPMGEDAVYPKHPAETLRATIQSGSSAGGGGAGAGNAAPKGGAAAGGAGGADDETASIVAQEQHGDELSTEVQNQSGAMKKAQDKQAQDAKTQKETSQKAVNDSIVESAKKQEETRTEVKKDVANQRKEWTEGQKKLVTTAQGDADRAGTTADGEVTLQRKTGETRAQQNIQAGDKEIATERQKAEGTAREKKREAKSKSSQGFFDWLGSAVKDFFDGIVSEIKTAFETARKAIKAAIKKAQELAVAAIDAARDAIVKAIRLAGDALIAVGDVVLAGFPDLRDKFKKGIHDAVVASITKVNAAADELKKDVVAALDLLGKGLDLLLGALLDALNAAIAAVASFVKGIIASAKAFVQALGAFAALIKDIAGAPGPWLRNLGAAVIDGIKNHLIKAFKNAIKKWFDATVGGLIGVGKMILDLLKKGGITWSMIVKMAWDALKKAIPMILIQLLIEKLVAMIVPAAGALMTIIEGLKAAWGTIQQIIAAFETFVAFLKAVKGGNGGPLFAATLASAAIVVIQFVAQWLLGKLKGAGGKVGGRLKELAQKILAGIKKAGRAIVGAAKRVGRAVVGAAKKVVQYVKKGAKWVATKAKAVAHKIANSKLGKALLKTKVGKAVVALVKKGAAGVRKAVALVKKGIAKIKDRYRKWKEKRNKKKEQAKADKAALAQKRLDRALSALRPKLAARFARGVSALRLRVMLGFWQIRYRLSSLSLVGGSGEVEVIAKVNPEGTAGKSPRLTGSEIRQIIQDVAAEIQQEPGVQEAARFQAAQPGTKAQPIVVTPGEGVLAQGEALRLRGIPATGPETRVHSSLIEGSTVAEKAGGARNTVVLQNNQFGPPYGRIGEEMKNTGLGKKKLTWALQTLVQTGEVPPGMEEHAPRLHELQRLLFGSEAARSQGAPLYAAMGLSLASRKDSDVSMQPNVSLQTLFGEKIGERTTKQGEIRPVYSKGTFPSALPGAVATQTKLEQGIEPKTLPEKRVALAQQELAEAWLVREGLYDLCVQDRRAGMDEVKRRLLEWFRGRK